MTPRRLPKRSVAPLLAILVAGAGVLPAPRTASTTPPRATGGTETSTLRSDIERPAYYRPVLLDGKAFPVLRSNFLSLLEFSNGWNDPRFRLVDGRWQLVGRHKGIDIVAEAGTPVVSMTPGVVENVGWTFYSGTRVGVRGEDGRYYLYAHLSSVHPAIAPGAGVSAGSVLGLVGNTGYGDPGHRDEFAPHLHFGIAAGGSEWVNPYPTLVRLYKRSVREQDRATRRLARVAGHGDRGAAMRGASRLYMPPGLGWE